jgi:hypothetical protein
MARRTPNRRIALGRIPPAAFRLAGALVAAALLVWAGIRVSGAARLNRGALRQAEATLATFESWRRQYRPAAAPESTLWRRARMEVQALGIMGDERLGLTQAISRAAEAAGLRDVRVALAPSDTSGAEVRLSTEGVRRQAAPFGLLVECRGGLQSVVTFLGELPPSVAPTQLTIARPDGRARHRIMLAVFELHLSNDTPGDITAFVTPMRSDWTQPSSAMNIGIDPFPGRSDEPGLPQSGGPAVARPAGARRLTAILVADDRRVAVIDDAAVSVGDLLRDGARVSAIQPDRVWVVDRRGQWRMLTLTNQGQ